MSVNKVILVGRLGQNPEMRYTPSGAAVANFSVATNENWTDKGGQKQERTEWHRIVAWGKQAELCNQYLSKGRQVYLEGRLQTRQWQDKDGQTKYTTEIHAQVIQFLGAGAGASGEQGQQQQAGGYSRGGAGAYRGGGAASAGAGNGGAFGAGAPSSSSAGEFDAVGNAAAGGGGGPFDQQQQSFTEDDVPF